MAAMNEWRTFAENIARGIHGATLSVDSFGYDEPKAGATRSRLVALSAAWLISTVEADRKSRGLSPADFPKGVIEKLPESEDPDANSTRYEAWASTRRARCEALWGIRVAIAHADLDTALIESDRNKRWARSAATAFDYISLDGTRLDLSSFRLQDAVWTIESIDDPPVTVGS